MLEEIVLGIIQGVAEWLPVSSEGLLVLAKRDLFGSEADLETIVREALFLHLGTFLAALVYFRRDVVSLLEAARRYPSAPHGMRTVIRFLAVATITSGLIGVFFLAALSGIEDQLAIGGRVLTVAIGVLLLVTGLLQLKASAGGGKEASELERSDDLLLGVAQGIAVLPGLSRSGLTVSALLLRGFDRAVALRLSFLMSLPIVLAGNIVLNIRDTEVTVASFAGLAASFAFGILTIDLLLRAARTINFGYFVIAFAVLVFASVPLS